MGASGREFEIEHHWKQPWLERVLIALLSVLLIERIRQGANLVAKFRGLKSMGDVSSTSMESL